MFKASQMQANSIYSVEDSADVANMMSSDSGNTTGSHEFALPDNCKLDVSNSEEDKDQTNSEFRSDASSSDSVNQPYQKNRNKSQPELTLRCSKQDSAKKEMSKRKSFEAINLSLNRNMSSKNALVALPDEKVQILDMQPRIDIIED